MPTVRASSRARSTLAGLSRACARLAFRGWPRRVARGVTRALLALGPVAACGHDGVVAPAAGGPKPARFYLVAFTYRDTIGGIIPAVAVQAEDAAGRPLSGVRFQWTTPDSGGAVTPSAGVTDAQGLGTARWQLGFRNGTQTLSATTAGLPPATALAYVQPGAITGLTVTPNQVTLGALGDTISLAVATTDRAGNAIIGPDLAWTSSDSAIVTTSAQFNGMPLTVHGTGTATLAVRAGTARGGVAVTVPAYAHVWTNYHRTCATTSAGALYCWGDDNYGALGDGTTHFRTSPLAVLAGTSVAQVAIADYSVCALATTGQTACTGFSTSGSRANATPAPAGAVVVTGAPRFVDVSAGYDSWCGTTDAGAAWCWGDAGLGQIGRDTTFDDCGYNGVPFACARAPIAVGGNLTFARVRVGPFLHACGVTWAGAAYCWGNDTYGQAGSSVGAPVPCGAAGSGFLCRREPVPVNGGLTFTDVQLGENYTCGLATTGAAYCWGVRWDVTESRPPDRQPTAAAPGLTFVALAADYDACGLTTAGAVYCWGGTIGHPAHQLRTPYAFTSLRVASGGYGGESLRICGTVRQGGVACQPFAPVGP